MKAIQTAILDPRLHAYEEEVESRIGMLFEHCPELAGFAVQDIAPDREADDSSYDDRSSGERPVLYVTDIGFSAAMRVEEIEGIYTLIGTAISDFVSELPEALELLRGRTFARTLH